MKGKIRYELYKYLTEEFNSEYNIKDMLINRIPFLKEYKIVEYEKDKN